MRKIAPISLTDVRVTSGVLGTRCRLNRKRILRRQYEKLVESGRIAQVLKAAGADAEMDGKGHAFWDSDSAKWLEAVAHSLAISPCSELEALADGVIGSFAEAQDTDGYLNTYYAVRDAEKRWTNLRDGHELYCAGHLMEAAAAYFEATGKRTLLDVMSKCADHIDTVFGDMPEKLSGYPGHPEIELALVKLARATGQQRYFDLARFFVNARGAVPSYFAVEAEGRGDSRRPYPPQYYQDHLPVAEQKEAVGHAVRAMYLYCGMVDVATGTNDVELLDACRRLWESVTRRKLYVTGGIGARPHGEAFGKDFELPSQTAYAETCAAIGLVFFAHRMLQVDADARYADTLERALYNGVLSGLSLDGDRYFYTNPLSYDGKTPFNHGASQRQEWLDCACCPPNLSRLLSSLGQYVYSQSDTELYVHLYTESEASVELSNTQFTVKQETGYPWEETVRMEMTAAAPAQAALHLRIPGWCSEYEFKIDGRPLTCPVKQGYLTVDRRWKGTTTLTLVLKMPVEQIEANPLADALRGCVCLQRGPVVFCAEQIDHDRPVSALAVPRNAALTTQWRPDLLGGCQTIGGTVLAGQWPDSGRLYAPVGQPGELRRTLLTAIPYALWANRGDHAMTVWLQRLETDRKPKKEL